MVEEINGQQTGEGEIPSEGQLLPDSDKGSEAGSEKLAGNDATTSEVSLSDDDKQEQTSALSLYRALKDPRTAKSILTVLAQEHNISFGKSDTPAEKQEKVSSLRDVIKEELGDEYQFLAGKLGNVMEKVLANERKLSAAQLAEISNRQAEREADEAFTWLNATYDDAASYESEIAALIERTPMPKNISAKEHLEELYAIAKHRGAKVKNAKALAGKITRNSSDPDTKLNGKRPVDSGVKPRPAESLDDAIARAMESIK